ncbi:MAG: 3-phosphoshikimate 1-carboxyvinyltransferase [Desulfotignum sp.]|nr:3-phosphoshikimate 1-carboxyvinyltransferase [Desulfotignum sp.]
MKQLTPKPISSPRIVTVPGSKSISHRMLICAALSSGISQIQNLLDSQDVGLTRHALSCLGAKIDTPCDDRVHVTGFAGHPAPYAEPIYLGNSGTSMRLLAGIAGLGTTPYTLTGDTRMRARPMKELLDALTPLGITAFSSTSEGLPPVTIQGKNRLGGNTRLDCTKSSQYLSALLMIGPFMTHGLTIDLTGPPVSSPYIDLTLDVMKQFQVTALRINETRYQVPGGQRYMPGDHVVEPDLSNAGYFWAAGAVTGQKIGVAHIQADSLQGDLKQIRILEKMGCDLFFEKKTVAVKGRRLKAVDVDMSDTPDAVPAIAVAAAFARGTTRIRNIQHLREKECDRIHAVTSQLEKMGIHTDQGDDWLTVKGGTPVGAFINTFNDHRIAMAFAVAGLNVPGMQIENPACVGKSFPGFWDVYDAL